MRRVLIVEPMAGEAQALKEALREAGLGIASIVVKNGAAARRHLAERDQDCVLLLNVHARDGDSMDFLDWLRGQDFSQKLLIVAVGERSQLRTVVEACERGEIGRASCRERV